MIHIHGCLPIYIDVYRHTTDMHVCAHTYMYAQTDR